MSKVCKKMYQDDFPVEMKLGNLEFDFEGKSVMDLGCNIGMVGEYVFKRGARSYKGVDKYAQFIEEGLRRNPTFDLDVKDIVTLDKMEEDVTIALGILHWLEDDDVIKVLRACQSEHMIMELPISVLKKRFIMPDPTRHMRTIGTYKRYIEEYYGIVKEVLDSGMNDHKGEWKRVVIIAERVNSGKIRKLYKS